MKCKHCGANFPIRELNCPYCNTVNPKGWMQKIDLERAELEYETSKNKKVVVLRRKLANHILNRALLIEIILIALVFLGAIGYFILQDFFQSAKNKIHADDIQAHMEQLYTQGRFNELDYYMDQNRLNEQAPEDYAQITRLQYYHNQFVQYRMAYFDQQEEGKVREYTASTLIGSMHSLLHPNLPRGQELTKRNQPIVENYQQEAEAFAIGILHLDETQMQMLRKEHLEFSEAKQLTQFVMEGGVQDADQPT